MYKKPECETATIAEPALAYTTDNYQSISSDAWNPNIPFTGTQEEWWEHFHRIEESEFSPVSEVHERITTWLENQKQ
ncbi:MAG: hypothetical protein LBE56_03355 [Tannerella sp.]|nr:hypothetical protein [Tannerella sp.]